MVLQHPSLVLIAGMLTACSANTSNLDRGEAAASVPSTERRDDLAQNTEPAYEPLICPNAMARRCEVRELAVGTREQLETLRGCTELYGIISISEVPGLTDLEPLRCLTKIDGELTIHANPALTSLRGLDQLAEITERLSIWKNPGLIDLRGLGALTKVEVEFEIWEGDKLESLAGLESLERVGEFEIMHNPNLASLAGLGGLVRVNRDLRIINNDALTQIEGLRTFSVGDDLSILDNAALESIIGLGALTGVGGDLEIDANYGLSKCTVDALGERLGQACRTSDNQGTTYRDCENSSLPCSEPERLMNPATRVLSEAALKRWPELGRHDKQIVSELDAGLAETASAFTAGPVGGSIWIVHGSNVEIIERYEARGAEVIYVDVPAAHELLPAAKWLIARESE